MENQSEYTINYELGESQNIFNNTNQSTNIITNNLSGSDNCNNIL